MMPDLGKYTFEVLACYGITLVSIFVLTGITVLRARRAKQVLSDIETRVKEVRHAD